MPILFFITGGLELFSLFQQHRSDNSPAGAERTPTVLERMSDRFEIHTQTAQTVGRTRIMRRVTLKAIVGALLCSGSAYAGSASYNFNSLSATNGLNFGGSLWDGVTTSGTGSANIESSGGAGAFGSTANGPVTGVMGDGFLQLTFADPSCFGSFFSSLCGGILFPDFDAGLVVSAFTLEADLRIGNGTTSPADGFSINYVRNDDPVLLALQAGDTFPEMNGKISPHGGQFSDNGNANDISLMEEGTQTGLSIGFDMWDSGNYIIPPISPAIGRVAPGLQREFT